MTFALEICGPFQWKPGLFSGRCACHKFRCIRVWWLWFAITWRNVDEREHHDLISSGRISWVKID